MNEIFNILKSCNSFALFCHINPDADALGSMNALSLALKKMGKKVSMYCDGKIPSNIRFLSISLDNDNKKIEEADACIMLDCNSLDRIGKYARYFEKAKIRVNIDHHEPMDYTFDYTYVDHDASSTADLVQEILKKLKITLDKEIAVNLYAGISSDTGCFQHSSTNAITHKHAYELLKYDFDLTNANYEMFKRKQKDFLCFYKTALRNIKPYFNGKVYVIYFNNDDYKRFRDICDISASFQFLDGIDGNEIRVKIIERQKNTLMVSLRSNKYVDVCKIAERFGGGGHKRAAGFTLIGSFTQMLPKILSACEEKLKEYSNK